MPTPLAALVKTVPDQAEVYASDLAAARQLDKLRKEKKLPASERSPREIAIDGVAHYVFNTLRGVEDNVNDATFEDVRVIVAKARF